MYTKARNIQTGVTWMGRWGWRLLLTLVLVLWLSTWLYLSPHLTPCVGERLSLPSSSSVLHALREGHCSWSRDIRADNVTNLQRPSVARELARRRVENTATELWYFLHARMKKLGEAVASDGTGLRELVASLREELQEYHVAMSHDVDTLRHVDGEEDWRLAESRQLGDLVQRRLDFLQNPADCSTARLLLCSLDTACGFGCQLHHAAFCLVLAYGTRRKLVLKGPEVPDTSSFFRPLSSSCTDVVGPWVAWSDSSQESARMVSLPSTAESLNPRPDFLPPAIPADLAPRLMAFHGDPIVWWLGQFLRYLTRPTTQLLQHIDTLATEVGFKHPIVGVQVRRGDKLLDEMSFHDLDEYMGHVDNYFRQTGHVNGTDRRVFLATDDINLVQEARRRYPDYTIISNMKAVQSAAGDSRSNQDGLKGVITDVFLLSLCDYLVCTFSSNVGRAAYALMQTRHGDASRHFRSLDDGYYFHGQNPRNTLAVIKHQARDASQLSFQQGDELRVHGNHWDGLTKATHVKSGITGLYPSFKATSPVQVVNMPTYPEVKEHRVIPAS